MFEVDSTKGLHYNFAHLALPILVLMNPVKFYGDISGTNNTKYLKSIWQGLAGRMGIKPAPSEFKVLANSLRGGGEVFTITLPAPTKVPDAFLASAVYQFEHPSLNKKIESVRYFTLELGKSPYEQSVEYHFCEWTGSVISGRQHKNYGRLEKFNVDLFVMAIEEVLNTGKLTDPDQKRISESEPKSIDEMSDLEKQQFIVSKLLPAMKEVAEEKFAERDAVIKETMAYVKKATKERDRNITIQRVFFVIIVLVVAALICYFSK